MPKIPTKFEPAYFVATHPNPNSYEITLYCSTLSTSSEWGAPPHRPPQKIKYVFTFTKTANKNEIHKWQISCIFPTYKKQTSMVFRIENLPSRLFSSRPSAGRRFSVRFLNSARRELIPATSPECRRPSWPPFQSNSTDRGCPVSETRLDSLR